MPLHRVYNAGNTLTENGKVKRGVCEIRDGNVVRIIESSLSAKDESNILAQPLDGREMSMGQMVDDVRLAVNGAVPVEFYGRTGGIIPTPKEVYDQIVRLNGGVQ